LSKVDPDAKAEKVFVDSSLANVKRLQYLIDQTLRASHMLDLNSAVMKSLLRKFEANLDKAATLSANCNAEFREQTLSILEETQIHQNSASSLFARATSTSQHVSQSIIQIRPHEGRLIRTHLKLRDVIAMRNNEFMKAISNSTIQGNEALFGLSQKAISEAQSMKAITVVALVYVPPSFVAVRNTLSRLCRCFYQYD